jgi:hypothetical protein
MVWLVFVLFCIASLAALVFGLALYAILKPIDAVSKSYLHKMLWRR